MRIVQIAATLSFGDAVTNDIIALRDAIREMGYETRIYAETIDARLPKETAVRIKGIPKLSPDDVVIYHLSIGTVLNYQVAACGARILLIYHNITPPEFYAGYKNTLVKMCRLGYDGAEYLADKVQMAVGDSEWNRQDLVNMGYSCPTDVLPILIRFEDYQTPPDEEILKKYKDRKGANILFLGRVAPNKCHEDVIAAFAAYQKNYDPDARLFLVGTCELKEYYARLCAYVKQLGADHVVFTDKISFPAMLAYYRVADVFLCQSEHEGFCVPLVESMVYDVPIIAYSGTAIPWTLGGCGIELPEKDPMLTAGVINRLMQDEALREQVIAGQRIRLKDYAPEKVKQQFRSILERFIAMGEERG